MQKIVFVIFMLIFITVVIYSTNYYMSFILAKNVKYTDGMKYIEYDCNGKHYKQLYSTPLTNTTSTGIVYTYCSSTYPTNYIKATINPRYTSLFSFIIVLLACFFMTLHVIFNITFFDGALEKLEILNKKI